MGLLTVIKGLPFAYLKDMQEDREYVFNGALSLDLSLTAMKGMIADLEVNKKAMK